MFTTIDIKKTIELTCLFFCLTKIEHMIMEEQDGQRETERTSERGTETETEGEKDMRRKNE